MRVATFGICSTCDNYGGQPCLNPQCTEARIAALETALDDTRQELRACEKAVRGGVKKVGGPR